MSVLGLMFVPNKKHVIIISRTKGKRNLEINQKKFFCNVWGNTDKSRLDFVKFYNGHDRNKPFNKKRLRKETEITITDDLTQNNGHGN